MGSGIAGLIRTRDLLGLATRIVGVVSTQAPAFALSFKSSKVVTTPTADTFADGVACRTPMADAVRIVCAGAERIVSVSEEEIAEAMRAYFRRLPTTQRRCRRRGAGGSDAGRRPHAGKARPV